MRERDLNLELTPLERFDSNEALLSRELINRDSIESRAQVLLDKHAKYEWEHLPSEDYNNAVTSLFEELRAAGDLSELDFTGNQDEIHAATLARLLNGYHTPAPDWEKKRRFAEICEELSVYEFYKLVKSGVLPADSQYVAISDFPDDAENDEDAHRIGYRGRNHKGMIRVYSFSMDDDGDENRHIEQISRSNGDTIGSTRTWFNNNAAAVPLNSTGALHEQLIMSKQRLPDGVISMMQELDESGEFPALYGETFAEAAERKRPKYENIRAVSLAERQREHKFVKELEDYESFLSIQLHNNMISYDEKLNLFHKKQKQLIERILIQAPEKFAHDARGAETVQHYVSARQALMAGDVHQYEMFMGFAEGSRDKLAGGSCGGSGSENDDSPKDLNSPESILKQFNDDKESREESSWAWKDGICRIESCKTRPGKTKVGPCSICKSCQKEFDSGNDPTKNPASPEKPKSVQRMARSIGDFLLQGTKTKDNKVLTLLG